MTFIDVIQIIRDETFENHITLRLEQELFYEVHAQLKIASSYEEHIVAEHQIPGLQASYGTILRFAVDAKVGRLTVLVSEEAGAFVTHQMALCRLDQASVRDDLTGEYSCYAPENASEFIDWVEMQNHGLI